MSTKKEQSPDKGAYHFDHEQWSDKVAYHREQQGAFSARSTSDLVDNCYHPEDLMLYCIMEMCKQIVYMLARDDNAAEEYGPLGRHFRAGAGDQGYYAPGGPPPIREGVAAPQDDPYATIKRLGAELKELKRKTRDLHNLKSKFGSQIREVVS